MRLSRKGAPFTIIIVHSAFCHLYILWENWSIVVIKMRCNEPYLITRYHPNLFISHFYFNFWYVRIQVIAKHDSNVLNDGWLAETHRERRKLNNGNSLDHLLHMQFAIFPRVRRHNQPQSLFLYFSWQTTLVESRVRRQWFRKTMSPAPSYFVNYRAVRYSVISQCVSSVVALIRKSFLVNFQAQSSLHAIIQNVYQRSNSANRTMLCLSRFRKLLNRNYLSKKMKTINGRRTMISMLRVGLIYVKMGYFMISTNLFICHIWY